MSTQKVAPGIHVIPLGFVNALLLEDDNGPVVVDTGFPGSADKILSGLHDLGYEPGDVQKIIVTHKHKDHTGSLTALKNATNAPAVMHPIDAAMVRKGETLLPVRPTPGLFSRLMFASTRFFSAVLDPVTIEEEVNDNDRLEIAGGIEVIHTPGHSAGQISLYLPRDGGILLVGDAAVNMMGLRQPPFYEDFAAGISSLRRLASLEFETAVFMHGKPIVGNASKQFKDKWANLTMPSKNYTVPQN